jgi:AcrR family transcriptional regulator
MGLRELKAVRTRDNIVDAALSLYEKQGYDETTMEEIAAAAEVGTSTLYRYFPTKDQILLNGLMEGEGALAGYFRARPETEDIPTALGEAINDYFIEAESHEQRIRMMRAVLDRSAAPRARLWDVWARERVLLEDAIAARLNLPSPDLRVRVAAQSTLMVVELALDAWRDDPSRPLPDVTAREVLALLRSSEAIRPVPAGQALTPRS